MSLTTQIFTEQKQVRKEEMLSDFKINREVFITLTKKYYKIHILPKKLILETSLPRSY